MIERKERRQPDEDAHPISENVLPTSGTTRAKVSRQQPRLERLSDATDYWGGDKNQDTGEARTVLHFAMEHYLKEHPLGQY